MKFSAALSTSLFATAALASPRHNPFHRAHSKSEAGAANTAGDDKSTINGITSSTWAGAVLVTEGPVSASGTEYCASIWVGIDGDSSSCGQAILQTGIDVCIKDGQPSYSAWYEWWPALDEYFDNFDISAGQTLQASVRATANNAGVATLENLSTGKSVSFPWHGNVQANLCQLDAEWIVEDFSSSDGKTVPFVDFDTVTFTNAWATVDGKFVSPATAQLWDISQDGTTLAHTSIDGSDVSISYVA
ncbi:aspergillopepsin-2 heavy chain [Penicillium chermesinum]|uniref:Aspergillopepsin-2 heavy chain n=1 Tax=Penicillium chermesinum TaxID=63820 RepID=A0A9W9P7L4_9EURO|nr:aspergillopepsin-2 heavy chain [Penicillium chermesinum]KAJ5239309.1 aspergillopepsin-2 heavy chain [Penicillium chermesinum]